MAGVGLLALFDHAAAITKIAAGKTVGVVADDVAVTAGQTATDPSSAELLISPERELPIVMKIAKGSAINKAFLIPGALLLNAAAPWAVTPLLMAGGAYLAYEGVEKVLSTIEKRKHAKKTAGAKPKEKKPFICPAPRPPLTADQRALALKAENKLVKSAIATDRILSAEIVMVTLGVVAAAPLVTQVIALTAVGALMTVGVYGVVGALVKADDTGLRLICGRKKKTPAQEDTGPKPGLKPSNIISRAVQRIREGKESLKKKAHAAWEAFDDRLEVVLNKIPKPARRAVGGAVMTVSETVLTALPVIGTAAMFLVGGGLVLHGIPGAAGLMHGLEHAAGAVLGGAATAALSAAAGVAVGFATVGGEKILHGIRQRLNKGKEASPKPGAPKPGAAPSGPANVPAKGLKNKLARAVARRHKERAPQKPANAQKPQCRDCA